VPELRQPTVPRGACVNSLTHIVSSPEHLPRTHPECHTRAPARELSQTNVSELQPPARGGGEECRFVAISAPNLHWSKARTPIRDEPVTACAKTATARRPHTDLRRLVGFELRALEGGPARGRSFGELTLNVMVNTPRRRAPRQPHLDHRAGSSRQLTARAGTAPAPGAAEASCGTW